MKKNLFAILSITFFANCNSPKTGNNNNRLELVPEPDRAERLKYEAIEILKKSDCNFIEPDTSLCGITLRNAESATKIIGPENKMGSDDLYHFYSNHEREILTLTQHPGDAKNQVSIFKVEFSGKASYSYKQLDIDTFKTEKGIKLGSTKRQILEKLGTCYAAIDSTKGYIELYYVIEQPKDSKSKLLERNNLPVYYASYKLWNDKLEKFEFGFQYP